MFLDKGIILVYRQDFHVSAVLNYESNNWSQSRLFSTGPVSCFELITESVAYSEGESQKLDVALRVYRDPSEE